MLCNNLFPPRSCNPQLIYYQINIGKDVIFEKVKLLLILLDFFFEVVELGECFWGMVVDGLDGSLFVGLEGMD